MSGSVTKEKMISVRLSGVEYEGLKAHFGVYGVRNLSEFARLALQRIVNQSAEPQDGFAAKLAELDERVRQLESDFSLLLDQAKIPEKIMS